MSENTESTLITGHEYDGIQEYDNPTPAWWHMVWIATMVLSVFYFAASLWSPMFVHQTDRLTQAQQAVNERLFAEIGDLSNTEADYAMLISDAKWMDIGASVFRANCASCHGADAGGSVGPNLRDGHYLNVVKMTDIGDVVRDGAAAGAMPAWQNRMHGNQIVLVSAYVASLRETGGGEKGPEGEEIPAWNLPE